MVFLILAILAIIIGILMLLFSKDTDYVSRFSVTGFILVFLGIFSIAMICQAGSSKTEKVLYKEIPLVSFSNSVQSEGGGSGVLGTFHVSVDANNVYSYRYEVKNSEFNSNGTHTYATKTVSKSDTRKVYEIEDPNCTTPKLQIYKENGITTWYALGKQEQKTIYVFYVPEGSIVKNVSLT